MSDDTVQGTAAAPVDQAPAAPAIDPATAAAIAQAVVTAMRATTPPAPPVTPADVPVPSPETARPFQANFVFGTQAAAAAAAPVDEPPYSEVFKPGSLAVHTYDHFGRTAHQVMVVLGTYQVHGTDPKTGAATVQDRVRLLPIGVTQQSADMPADTPALLPADQFDWEPAA